MHTYFSFKTGFLDTEFADPHSRIMQHCDILPTNKITSCHVSPCRHKRQRLHQQHQHQRHRCHASQQQHRRSSDNRKDAASLDVSSTVVDTAFRVTIDKTMDEPNRTSVNILFVSESGVARAPLAAAALSAALARHHNLSSLVHCAAAACRDYNVGDSADNAALKAAQALGWNIPSEYSVSCFHPAGDLVRQDLILVMDKFTAADVLREASVFDTIYLQAGYSGKVRSLIEFLPRGDGTTKVVEEIGDPLYGNVGGEEEEEAVERVAMLIGQCCEGLAAWLAEEAMGGGDLRERVGVWLQGQEGMEWMRPPLLSPR